jgi:short-subunit dehydrogenase involved in D-alanine esterification of teichoic acids
MILGYNILITGGAAGLKFDFQTAEKYPNNLIWVIPAEGV